MTKPKIVPTQPKDPDMEMVYLNAIIRKTEQPQTPDYPKQIVTLGIKYLIISRPHKNRTDPDYIRLRYALINYVQAHMLLLTPRQITQLFPIEKQFDGKRWGCKDFFTTAAYLKTLDMDAPIKDERKLMDFFWEYRNFQIEEFWVEIFSNMDDMAHLQGEAGPLDKMIDQMGIETHTLHEDPMTGQEYLQSNTTGKVLPVSTKPRLTLVQ